MLEIGQNSRGPENPWFYLCPVVLRSDKTTVSVGTGKNEYHPLYISKGLVHNNIWHAHQDGVMLLAFLAIPKSKYFCLRTPRIKKHLNFIYLADKEHEGSAKF